MLLNLKLPAISLAKTNHNAVGLKRNLNLSIAKTKSPTVSPNNLLTLGCQKICKPTDIDMRMARACSDSRSLYFYLVRRKAKKKLI